MNALIREMYVVGRRDVQIFLHKNKVAYGCFYKTVLLFNTYDEADDAASKLGRDWCVFLFPISIPDDIGDIQPVGKQS